ncbi:PTS sugar transporter subunit IIA [Breznakiella homolactica]|uniref:PTS EIIA type-4 domain-containing protein n=1 Tax=Breznakiella homolactica TaxID=2798577 RepID=A0A7T7XLN2_9SPIR|nr:hypothetical protein [Breznakiella homolactica]QQO08528.1 hypothetical protein JFL75_16560 [Breznakiella homolactica]
MSKKILIATHTTLAEGFKKATVFFTGMGEDMVTICAYEDTQEPPRPEIDRFFESVNQDDTVVVFTDLMGGSVNQIMMEKLLTRKFHLITDPNLSVIMAVATLGEEELNAENIRESIELSSSQMKYMNDVPLEQGSQAESDTADDFF